MKKEKQTLKIDINPKGVELISVPEQSHFDSGIIAVFTSFDEENEATAKQNAQITPIEHLKNAHSMIVAMYETELKSACKISNHITFVISNGLIS